MQVLSQPMTSPIRFPRLSRHSTPSWLLDEETMTKADLMEKDEELLALEAQREAAKHERLSKEKDLQSLARSTQTQIYDMIKFVRGDM